MIKHTLTQDGADMVGRYKGEAITPADQDYASDGFDLEGIRKEYKVFTINSEKELHNGTLQDYVFLRQNEYEVNKSYVEDTNEYANGSFKVFFLAVMITAIFLSVFGQ